MNCKTTITSIVSLGGGIGSYVAYKIDVTYENQVYAIFRRFRDFAALHHRLLGNYSKETLDAGGVVLPDHAVGIGKTFKFVTSKRMTALQEYLTKVFLLEEVQTHTFLTETFLDRINQGKSGAVKEIGAKTILLESFGDIKPCRKAFEFWHSVYLVLTRAGTLYVFKNYDDGLFQAFITFPIAGREIHVESRAGTKNIELIAPSGSEAPPQRIILNLPTDIAVASWLRSIADFGTKGGAAAAQYTPRASGGGSFSGAAGAGAEAGGATPQRASASTPATPASEIRAKGTGHTTDELSAMYGV